MGLDRSYQSSYANIYSTLRCVLDDMDIVQALDDLEHRLISLRDRTASKMVADQPVATKSDSTEVGNKKFITFHLHHNLVHNLALFSHF